MERVDEIVEEKLSYMEKGIKSLDEEGYFGTGDVRNKLVVTVMVAEGFSKHTVREKTKPTSSSRKVPFLLGEP